MTTVQRWEKREGMPVHRHVHDKRGSVYALTLELDAWLQSRRPRLEEEEGESAAQTPVDTEGGRERRAMPPARLLLALAGVALLAVLALAYIMSRGRADNAARPKIKSLAVLPLKNLSGDPTQDYLADGMTEALIGRLASISDLRVISHTSVMRFKNPQISVPEIARTLNVDAIVEGSVIRDGNRIRVTAQLIRGATDEHFWSETYDRELRDVLALQSDVAQSIAESVEVTVTGEEHARLAAARPVAPEVYESYLQGWYELNKSYNKADIEKGLAYFQNAINTDPTFAPAYVGLASAYSALGSNFVGDPHDPALQKEMSAAQKAVELDPNLADAHALLGDVQKERWQWADAQAEYRRALELNPHNADAYADLAWWLLCQGRTDEALASMRRARELDPLSVDATDMGWMLFEARRYDEATHELRSVLQVNPNDPVTLWDLGISLIDKNQPQDAIPVLEKALSLSNRSPGVTGTLIRAYALAGRRRDALRLLKELQVRSKAGFVPASAFVNAYLGLGENEQVFVWLEQAYKEHSNILQFLKVDPALDPIRTDPRFADLLRRVGLG
ncbi:MAG TPA: tetratricopeptide repeat protein [Candidatus Acidoferrales bacterium]|nr:tetratricopeptide repeat protein [Candidatus Acidoferrales bacterium]